jgi:hypothetical protein
VFAIHLFTASPATAGSRSLILCVVSRVKSLSVVVVLAAISAAQSVGPDVHLFDYDSKAPLDFHDNGAQDTNGSTVHDISYASPKGGRVPAFLVVPLGKEPFPAVIFVHWGQGNRTEFLSEALILARAGAESLLIDGVFNRPGGWETISRIPKKRRKATFS